MDNCKKVNNKDYPTIISFTICNRIRSLRLAHGYSIKYISESTGCPISTLYKYEDNTRGISRERARMFEKFYGLKEGWFDSDEFKKEAKCLFNAKYGLELRRMASESENTN